ncbi:hypothetical protein [Paenarthrobacter sp. YIM B13468]|uniref:hypothetical protein n=1 Tax=Paenarthrobacter sp. YIM B13468 TaxID=3366295 RepID=UPI003673196C
MTINARHYKIDTKATFRELRTSELTTWLQALEDMAVNTDHLGPVYSSLANVGIINRYAKDFKEANGIDSRAAARRLAAEPGSYDTATALVTTVSVVNTDDYLDEAIETFELAVTFAEADAWQHFRRASSRTVELLKPLLADAAAGIQKTRDAIPDSTKDLEDAARRGKGEAWLQLEKHLLTLDTIGALLADWHSNKIINNDSKRDINNYSINQLLYEDADQISQYAEPAKAAGMNRMMARARAITLARPRIHTPAEADAKRSKRGEVSAASIAEHEAKQDVVYGQVRSRLQASK